MRAVALGSDTDCDAHMRCDLSLDLTLRLYGLCKVISTASAQWRGWPAVCAVRFVARSTCAMLYFHVYFLWRMRDPAADRRFLFSLFFMILFCNHISINVDKPEADSLGACAAAPPARDEAAGPVQLYDCAVDLLCSPAVVPRAANVRWRFSISTKDDAKVILTHGRVPP
jgi:hypothetical protein